MFDSKIFPQFETNNTNNISYCNSKFSFSIGSLAVGTYPFRAYDKEGLGYYLIPTYMPFIFVKFAINKKDNSVFAAWILCNTQLLYVPILRLDDAEIIPAQTMKNNEK